MTFDEVCKLWREGGRRVWVGGSDVAISSRNRFGTITHEPKSDYVMVQLDGEDSPKVRHVVSLSPAVEHGWPGMDSEMVYLTIKGTPHNVKAIGDHLTANPMPHPLGDGRMPTNLDVSDCRTASEVVFAVRIKYPPPAPTLEQLADAWLGDMGNAEKRGVFCAELVRRKHLAYLDLDGKPYPPFTFRGINFRVRGVSLPFSIEVS